MKITFLYHTIRQLIQHFVNFTNLTTVMGLYTCNMKNEITLDFRISPISRNDYIFRNQKNAKSRLQAALGKIYQVNIMEREEWAGGGGNSTYQQ